MIPLTTIALARLAGSNSNLLLPDPGLLWLRARLRSRQEAEEQLLEPLSMIQKIAWFVVTLGWATVFTLKWPTIFSWMTNLDGKALLEAFLAAATSPAQTLLVFGLATATAVLTFHGVFAEE